MKETRGLESLRFLPKASIVLMFSIAFMVFVVAKLNEKRGEFSSYDQSFYEYIQNNSLPDVYNNHETVKTLPKLICFYTFSNQFEPEIMKSLCTHINVGFFSINSKNFSLNISEENQQLLSKVVSLKNKDNNLKVLISVGGAGFQGFSAMVESHITRKMFIHSAVQFLKEFEIDGIDLDWEWPVLSGNAEEKIKFIQLLYEMRQEFNRHTKQYILSLDVSSIKPVIDLAYHVQYITYYVDFVNVMCYDYHFYTKWYPLTGHNAPLHTSKSNGNPFFFTHNVNYSIFYWISKSMPREKIILGLPTFGHTFKLSTLGKNDLNAPASGFGSVGQDGFITYSDVCRFVAQRNTTVVFDKTSQVPYAYNFPDWISYDNEISLEAKASYILSQKLGGAMIYSINADDYLGFCSGSGRSLPLTKKIRSVLYSKS